MMKKPRKEVKAMQKSPEHGVTLLRFMYVADHKDTISTGRFGSVADVLLVFLDSIVAFRGHL